MGTKMGSLLQALDGGIFISPGLAWGDENRFQINGSRAALKYLNLKELHFELSQ
jgi:hypothetical protein